MSNTQIQGSYHFYNWAGTEDDLFTEVEVNSGGYQSERAKNTVHMYGVY